MKALIAALLLAPAFAFGKAEPVSLNFNAVPIVQFGQAMFKGMMKRDFVVAPDVVSLDRKITIDVKSISSDDLPRFVEDLLAREGIQTTLQDGVYYLTLRRLDALGSQQDAITGKSPSAQPTTPVSSATSQKNALNGDGHVLPDAAGFQTRKDDDESEIFLPTHRTSEFVAAVVAAGFGPKAVTVAGELVVLTGSKAAIAKMLSLCRSLDTHAKMVDVSASWIEVTNSSGSGRGISLAATFLGARLGASLGTVNSGSAVSLKNTRFELVMDALNSDSRFKQVTNSRLVGYDRSKLKLTVGDKTATVSSAGNDNAGNRVQNIVYTPSGAIIDALPRVLGGGEISLDVDAQISSFKANTNGLIGSPTLILRQLTTTVGMKDGDVILLGGLQDTQASESKSGLAFLPSSWSTGTDSKQQTDLVLVVSAKVLAD
jgi:type II secretory pathway component GspD/PulD (secretin)